MDYRDGSSIPGANGIWVPETPLKVILTEPEPICTRKQEGQLHHENWLVTESSSQKSQAQRIVASCLSKSPIFNQEFEAVETTPADNVCDMFSLDSSAGRWNETSFRDLLALADAATARRQSEVSVFDSRIEGSFPLPADYLSLGTNLWSTEDYSLVMPQCGNSIPSGQTYDLHSPPRMSGAVLSRTISSQFAPITPDQTKRVENTRESVYETANQARDMHENEVAATRIEVSKLCENKEQLQLQDSCAEVSTTMLENHNPDKGGNHGIDLNKTPQQKQRRRKHRPKVVIEGQPKRTQKPVAPKPAGTKENQTQKRKYVRRNGLNKSKATPTEVNRSTTAERTGCSTRSCRKSLNFDFESEVRDENYSTIPSSNFIPASQPQNLYSRSESKSSNNSNCSTSTFTETEEANGLKRKRWCASNESVNLMEAHYNSLQAYLMSTIDECSLNFPAIYKRKRTEKWHSSTTSALSTMTAAEYSPAQAIMHPLNEAPANPCMSKTSNVRISAAQLTTSNTPIEDAAVKGIQNKQEASECVLALTHIRGLTKKRSKGPIRVRDLTSLNIVFENNPKLTYHLRRPITSDEMYGQETSNKPKTCMEALVAATNGPIATKKRTKKYYLPSSVPTSIYNCYRPQAKSKGAHRNQRRKKMSHIDAIVEQLKCLDINMETNKVANQQQSALVPYNLRYQQQNALVLYQRDGTLMPFEGSFYPVKKRKPRAKVDLDEETNRVWKLLLENINSEGIDGTDEEKAKWWEEERKVFHGRVETFINRMHLVQGDRRFSPWKGSVVDSVVGVFLTQNVSDHLSSSAYMSLAARFPLKSNSNQGSCPEDRTSIPMKQHVHVLDPEESINWYDEKSNQAACDQNSTTSHDMGYNEEKEVVDSNKSPESNLGSVRSTDNLICGLLDSSRNSVGMCLKSAGNRLTTEIAGAVESFTGDQTEMEDTFSSQNYVISAQDSVNFSIAQTADRINSEAYLTPSSEPNCFSGSISFVELLQMAGNTTLHEVTLHAAYSHESANALSNNKADIMGCGSQKQQDRLDGPNTSSAPTIPPSNCSLQMTSNSQVLTAERIENCTSKYGALTAESVIQARDQIMDTESFQEAPIYSYPCNCIQKGTSKAFHSQIRTVIEHKSHIESWNQDHKCGKQQVSEAPSGGTLDITESTSIIDNPIDTEHKADDLINKTGSQVNRATSKLKKERARKEKHNTVDWDNLRKQAQASGKRRERVANTMDSLDWEAVRCASVNEIAYTIKERGMNNMLAERIKDFLNRLVREHGSIDLEWLRDVPPDEAKEYLLSIRGLGLKSVECVRLLTLHHLAFPVDTNVGRIVVRLGWVPLQPLPDSLQLHLLELYPVLESIQKYLWPRLCKLDQRTLYELHYQMITFGKVFCTKSKPNCNACPMRGECRHFASAFASTRLALPGPEEKRIVSATETRTVDQNSIGIINPLQLSLPQPNQQPDAQSELNNCQPIIDMPTTPEPIIEVPPTPEPERIQTPETDIEDIFCEDPNEIPTIKLNIEEFTQNLQNYMQQNMELQEGEMSKALVALTPEAASIPMPKLKNVSRLRTEHHVYELPDSHPLLAGLDKREPDDPCSYLLAIWTPGETANSIQPPEGRCSSQEFGRLCDEKTCFSCNGVREANSQIVRGTLLIPCRTAMRGRFPLNGTYFQVNEVFADHESSINPIDVPRAWVWNLPRRTVYFGTSIPTIFKGLPTEGIQYCFWRGLVCVRGFDQKTRAPRPLMARLHFPASKLTRTKVKKDDG